MTEVAQAVFSVSQALDLWADGLAALASKRGAHATPWRAVLLRRAGQIEAYTRRGNEAVLAGTIVDGPVTARDAQLAAKIMRECQTPSALVLRLAPDEVVHKQLTLPVGVRDVLAKVLYNQIERLAPWPADQAMFAFSAAHPAADGPLTVDVWVTSRSRVDDLMAALAALGLSPGIVDVGEAANAAPGLNFLANGSGRQDGAARARVLLRAAVISAVVLSVSATAYGGYLSYRHDVLTAKAQTLSKAVAATTAAQNPDLTRRQDMAFELRQAQPSFSILIEALSRALPDGASLERLDYREGTLTLSGRAQNAPALIAQIETSPLFTEVKFAAPTTRRDGEDGVQFSVSAKVAGSGAAALPLQR